MEYTRLPFLLFVLSHSAHRVCCIDSLAIALVDFCFGLRALPLARVRCGLFWTLGLVILQSLDVITNLVWFALLYLGRFVFGLSRALIKFDVICR